MKRVFDFTAALIGLILLSPVFLVISLMILILGGSPVVYKQKRIGKDMKEFTIYKFRTMKNGTRLAATVDLSEADEQIIPCGKLLRKTSLDELPQLINILKGDMSFVGPRPLIPEEGEIHTMRNKAGVYTVRPGLTGLAQISGRDKVSDEDKVEFDRQYVESQSLLLDMKIFLRTFTNVFAMKDVVEGGHE